MTVFEKQNKTFTDLFQHTFLLGDSEPVEK